MKTKKRMKHLALFIASVVAFTMLPTNVLEVKAGSDICTCGHFYDDHASGMTCKITGCSCTGFSPSSSSSSYSEKQEESEPSISAEERQRIEEEEAQKKREEEYRKNSTISSGGTYLKTTIDGAYTAQSVEGTVITTPKEQLMESFALKEGQSLRVETWDVTKGNSPNAMRSLEAGAKSIGGVLGPAIQVNIKKTNPQVNGALKAIVKAILNDKEGIGYVWSDVAIDPDALAAYLQDKPGEQEFLAKYNNVLKEASADPNWDNASTVERWRILDQLCANNGFGNYSDADDHLFVIREAAEALAQQNSQGTAEMTVGLPENLRGSDISVVKVTEGGNIQVLQDKDNNSNTVSFTVTEGEAAYALVNTNPKASGALKAIVKAILNDKEGIGDVWSDVAIDPDALAAYLQDKPGEQEFLAKYNNVLKEASADSNWDNASIDERERILDQLCANNGFGNYNDANHHLFVIRKAAEALAQ